MATVFLNWGDTNKQQLTLTGTSVSVNHIYADTSGYIIDLSGRTSQISGMTLSGTNITDISGFSDSRITITSLNLNNNKIGFYPSINNNLKYLYLDSNRFSGNTTTISNKYSGSTLETLSLNNISATTYNTNSLPTTMHSFSANDNPLNMSSVHNIVNDMYNNSSSKSGMSIMLINTAAPLTGVTQKYALIDNSGATVKTTGRFTLEVMRSSARDSGQTFQLQMSKPITNKNTNLHIDYDDGNTQDMVLTGSSTYGFDISKIYSSGLSSMTYHPKIDGHFDDIISLTVNRTYNFTAGATIDVREFPNLETLSLPYYDQYVYPPGIWYYHCRWVGPLDLHRNNKIKQIYCSSHGFTSLVWPNDVTHFTSIDTNNNNSMNVTSPRIDLMPNLTNLTMDGCRVSGNLYDPNPSKKITNYDMGYIASTINAGPIPDFTNCTGLTYINIYYSNRNSNGNTDWSTLTNLTQIQMQSNPNLTGTVIDFDLAPKLNNIYIGSTGYQTFGSSNWNTLTGLTTLDMSNCSSLSDIMPALTNSTSLQSLSMYSCKLYGQCINTTIFPSLTTLNLQSNKLSKEFPNLSNNTHLTTLQLQDNMYNQWGSYNYSWGGGTAYGITDIKLSGNSIFVAGQFSSYSGQTANKLIKLNSGGTINCLFDQYDKFLVGDIYNEYFKSIGIQSNGGMVAVGTFTYVSGQTCNYIVRFNSGGTVDTGFSMGTGFGNIAKCVAIQSDDKILVGGNFTTYDSQPVGYFIRLNSGGTKDISFNMGVGFNNVVETIVVQNDGKILVGGSFGTYSGITGSNNMIRLDSGGTKDSSFNMGAGFNGTVYTIAVQTDGKILVGGSFSQFNSTGSNNRIIRLDSGGTIDTTFNVGTGFNNTVYTIIVQTDGKILVGGYFNTYSGITSNYIIRLDSGGTIDNTFNTINGFENSIYGSSYAVSYVNTIAVQTDGKILVGGSFYSYSGQTAKMIVRLNSNGTIDNTFDIGSNRKIPDLTYNTSLSGLYLNTCGLNTYTSFVGLTSLSTISLSYNGFIHFPDFSNLTNLSSFSINRNCIIDDLSLSGTLKSSIRTLNLEYNRIIGTLPTTAWSGLTNLTSLYLGYNNITGPIPTYFSGFTNLSTFDAPNNQMSGDMTPIGHTTLTSINITNNLFTSGATSLSGATNMNTLNISNNNFGGCTFFDISNFHQLQYIYINNCNLSGTLGPFPMNNYYIWYIYMQNNQFVGDIPAIPTVLYYCYGYDVSYNLFTGYTSMTIGIPNPQMNSVNFRYNYLSSTEVNKVLADVVKTTRTGGQLYLDGPGMGAPTGQGITDMNTLINTKYWSVTHN